MCIALLEKDGFKKTSKDPSSIEFILQTLKRMTEKAFKAYNACQINLHVEEVPFAEGEMALKLFHRHS